MRFLRSNTAVLVSVGPFYDRTDGVTIETALTITNERITLTADTDDNNAPTNILDNVTGATSGTSNDLNYITGNDAGMMQMELSAANTNRLGRMLLSITDAANHVPVFHEFMVVNTALYDAFFASSGGAIPNAVAGAANGVFIAGTNAATTVTTALTTTFTGNLTGSVGSVTGAVGSVTGAVGSIASAGITEASFATTAGSFHPQGIVDQGTAQSATGTTLVLRSAASFTDDQLIGATILITGGTTGTGERRLITDYVSSTDTATVDAWNTTPTGTITYKIFATAPSSGGSGLDAAGVRAAIGMSSANLDTQLSTIDDFLDTEIAAIKTKTDFLPSATAGAAGGLFIAGTNAATTITTALTTTFTGNLTGNVGGNVTGSIGSLATQAKADVNAEVDSALDTDIPAVPTAGSINDVLNDLDARLPGSGTLSILSAAAVNAEVVDALAVDTYAEPAQGAPAATTTLAAKINYLFKAWRNKTTQTSTTFSLYADDASTVDQKATVSDDATTFTKGEIGSGP